MPYLGNLPAERFTSFDKQTITGDGGASYTLDHAVANEQEIEVFVNNVRQEPSVAYTVSGTALTMTGNVESSDDFYVVFQGKATQTATHPETFDLKAVNGTFSGDVSAVDGTFTGSVDVTGTATVDGLTVDGDSTINSTSEVGLLVQGNGSRYLQTERTTSGTEGKLIMGSAGNFNSIISRDGSTGNKALAFTTGTSERMRILSSGGITFNGDTSAANALDDYEEGTFTPDIGSTVGSKTSFVTHANNSGFYVKVGRMVFVSINLRGTYTIGTAAGVITITGLPFTLDSSTGSSYSSGVISYQTGLTPPSNASAQGILGLAGQSYCYVSYMLDNAGVGYFTPSMVSTGTNAVNIHVTMVYYVA